MIRVLCTGGAGYVGSVLVPLLLEDKRWSPQFHVTVLDRFSHMENSLAMCCRNPNFEMERGDCRDVRVLEPLVKQADIILPLAAVVGAPACALDEPAALSLNHHAIATICGLASAQQRVIFPNTNSCYGTTAPDEECTEDTPAKAISLYGKTKLDAEGCVMDRENSIALRLATAFGASPRQRLDLLLNDFVYRAYLDKCVVVFEGHFRRNFIHVRDIANAFLHSIYKFDEMKGKVYNCGLSDANMTKIELCERIKKHVPHFVYVESQIGTDPDRRDYTVSNKRIESTGFRCVMSVDDGIIEMLKLCPTLRNHRYSNL